MGGSLNGGYPLSMSVPVNGGATGSVMEAGGYPSSGVLDSQASAVPLDAHLNGKFNVGLSSTSGVLSQSSTLSSTKSSGSAAGGSQGMMSSSINSNTSSQALSGGFGPASSVSPFGSIVAQFSVNSSTESTERCLSLLQTHSAQFNAHGIDALCLQRLLEARQCIERSIAVCLLPVIPGGLR
jgi:hypothetical protein